MVELVKHFFAVPSLDRKAVGRYKCCQTYQNIITNLPLLLIFETQFTFRIFSVRWGLGGVIT